MNINEVAKLAGVSVRTLHHYDQIELLVPTRSRENSYREYTQDDINTLQEILLLRRCGLKLSEIKCILQNPSFNRSESLKSQKLLLKNEVESILSIIETIDKTIMELNGEIDMTNEEKFEALKASKIKENEEQYGKEVREKYSDEVADKSNRNFMNIKQDLFEKSEILNEEILKLMLEKQDPEKLAELHKQWLMIMWGDAVEYSKATHLALIDGYLADERFISYYNNDASGIEFLKESVEKYLK